MNDKEDFKIKNNVLIEYIGNDKDVTVPSGVTEIKDYAFEYCESLESVTIPEGVTKIGKDLFSRCENLATVTLPDTLSEIKDDIFGNYKNSVVIDLSKYNPSQFDYKVMERCLVYNASSLLENKDIEKEKLEAWIDYLHVNADLYYDELIECKSLFQFMVKYKCLILEDVMELLNRASEEELTEFKNMVTEYEHNNFTEEEIIKFKNSEFNLEDCQENN